MSKNVVGLLSALALAGCAHKPKDAPPPVPPPAKVEPAKVEPRLETPDTWRAGGLAALAEAQKPAETRTQATNLILFIGDGMGLTTVTAARILQAQIASPDAKGEENQLSFERFPATALAKTYNIDLQTPESAGSMTAILTGVKTRGSSLGLNQTALRGLCKEAVDYKVDTLLEQAKDRGLSAGLVSTARITHAVPAAAYAHITDPDWETDARMPEGLRGQCLDIARQLVEFGRGGSLDVVLGGGRSAFTTSATPDPWVPGRSGARLEGNLIARWEARNPQGAYVTTADQLKDKMTIAGALLGLFAPDSMAFEAARPKPGPEPSLTTMTTAAITKLSQNKAGYVLVVDAGGIDRAHHAGQAQNALNEAVELSNAVQAALDATKGADTLIVVTADHGDTLTLGGYPPRGNKILGLVLNEEGVAERDARGRPYTALAYANGPGAPQPDAEAPPPLTDEQVKAVGYAQAAAIRLPAATHGGADVPVYAIGPGSQWFHGTLEQNSLYWLMQAALKGLHDPPNAPPEPEKKKSPWTSWIPDLNPFDKDKAKDDKPKDARTR